MASVRSNCVLEDSSLLSEAKHALQVLVAGCRFIREEALLEVLSLLPPPLTPCPPCPPLLSAFPSIPLSHPSVPVRLSLHPSSRSPSSLLLNTSQSSADLSACAASD
eukprot:251404-Rhodomonas_salina.1